MLAEDLKVFFREFSTPVTATLSDGGRFSFRAIFNDADMAGRFGNTNADLTQPRLTCAASDTARLARNTPLTVHEPGPRQPPRDYRVLEIIPDGTGTADIILAPPSAPPSAELHNALLDADDS